MASNWWIFVLVIVGVIALYLLVCFIVYLLMKRAQKKVAKEMEALVPKERERFEVILDVRDAIENDNRHLPKQMLDDTREVEELFQKVPVDLKEVKGRDDFLILYYRKYLKEKGLLSRPGYKELDKKLENIVYLKGDEKDSPYYRYNKAALHYNAYLSMGGFNIFRGKAAPAPVL